MKREPTTWKGPLLVALVVGLLLPFLPLGVALEFGGDEGYEFMKALLHSQGFVLYQQIWSDQPPLWVILLSTGFKIAGPTLLVGRLIAAVFGILLYSVFFHLVRRRNGPRVAGVATFLLAASPMILALSLSAMQEVPAFATALLSAALLVQGTQRFQAGWFAASGLVMGVALGIKWTALLVAPAMLAELFVAHRLQGDRRWWWHAACHAFWWGLAALALYGVVHLMWGRGSALPSLRAHTMALEAPGLGRPQDLVLPPSLLLDHGEGLVGAAVGLAFMVWRRNWRALLFPAVLLATVTAIHAVHRPWWSYYYLHLALPLAWLAAYAAGELYQAATRLLTASRYRLTAVQTWQGGLACLMIGFLLVRGIHRVEAAVTDLRQRPAAASHPLVQALRAHARPMQWVYAHDAIYPFAAGLRLPPELAVVSWKRYWSGQITDREIVEVCRRYGVEQLLLTAGRVGPEWSGLLESYTLARREGDRLLYQARQPYPQPDHDTRPAPP